MRVLKQGMTGEDVRNLQYRLKIKVDGIFGPNTTLAVKTEQKKVGFTGAGIDGIVGPNTQKAFGLSDFRVHIYKRSDYDIWFAGAPYNAPVKPLKPLKTWAAEQKSELTYNLAWFNMTGTGSDQYGVIKGRTVTYVKAQGQDIGYGGTIERLTLDAKNVCSGAKLAVWNGAVKYFSPIAGKTAQNAHGLLKDGSYFHIQTVLMTTEYALVQHMIRNYQVQTMLIQDGGGSTGFYDAKYDSGRGVLLAGKREGTDGRPVASVVCIKKKLASVPVPTPPAPQPTPTPQPVEPKLTVYVCDEIKSVVKYELDPSALIPGSKYLTAKDFKGSSTSLTMWISITFIVAYDKLCGLMGGKIPMRHAFRMRSQGGHAKLSQHYCGRAADCAQVWNDTDRERLRTMATYSKIFTYVEPASLAPTWVHIDTGAGYGVYTTISNGSTGTYVFALQEILRSKGYNVALDGIFGDFTEASVKRYQINNGLTPDGSVGSITWRSLVA